MEVSLETGIVIVAAKRAGYLGLNAAVADFDFVAVLGAPDSELWKEAETKGAHTFFYPLGFSLLRSLMVPGRETTNRFSEAQDVRGLDAPAIIQNQSYDFH